MPPNTETYTDWGLERSVRYTYRIQAYNEFGSSNWDEKTETAVGPQTSSIYPPTKVSSDAYVMESTPDGNFANERFLTVAGYEGGHENALLLFSLPNLPSHAEDFQSAKLGLCEAGGGNTIYPGNIKLFVAPIANQWNESTVTWNNRPGTWLSDFVSKDHNPNNAPCVEIDISNIVSKWYSGARSNLGLNIFSGSSSYVSYYSREGYEPGSGSLQINYSW